MPPAKLGVVYALKGLRRLVSRVGEQAARRMFLTGRPVEAEEAQRLGLLDVLHPDAEGQAVALAKELAGNAPLAVQGMKRGLAMRENDEAYERLRRASFNSEDAKEGKAALMEKRAPAFRGR
jgi:enoyl-CoA hydratase/carnithine racemase